MALEHRPDHVELRLVELHIGQAGRGARQEPEHVERRLGGAGQGRDGHVAVHVLQALVDLAAPIGLVGHPVHLLAEQVRGHQDPAGLPHVEYVG